MLTQKTTGAGRALEKLAQDVSQLDTSVTWDPGSIADGDEAAVDVSVPGAVFGDFALASFSADIGDLNLVAQVTAAGVVTAQLNNNTGGAIDLASGTLYIRVLKRV